MESYGRTKAVITKIEKFAESEAKGLSKNLVKHKLDVLERNFTKFSREIDEVFEEQLMTEAKYDEELKLYSEKYENVKILLNAMYDESVTENEESESDTDGKLKLIVKQQSELLKKLCTTRACDQSIRLPQVTLKPFDGTYAEWTSFRDLFGSSIKDNKLLPPVEKLYYLRSYLRGDAERIIKNIAVTDANFEVAWKLLADRYENNKAILDDIIRRFQSTKRIQNPRNELKHFATGFNEMLTALDMLGDYGKQRDPWVISNALGMLDEETVELWARHSVSIQEPTCANFLAFLQSRQSQIEISRHAATTRPAKSKSSQVMTVTRTTCFLCNGDHTLVNCQKLLSQPLDQRVKVISENRLCFNCLRKGHIANKCTSSFRCTKCKGRHHTIIHGSNNNNSKGTNVKPEDKAIEMIEVKSNVLQVAAQTCDSEQTVLLPTAEVLVQCCDGRLVHCRALMDSGSQVNLISESMFLKLGVGRSGAKRLLKGISSDGAQVSRGASAISICSRFDTTQHYLMEFLIVKNLSGDMPERQVIVKETNALRNYQLADDHFAQPAEIDMLIGVNGYCQLTRPGKNFIRKDQLWMLNSVFGWLICGGRQESISSRFVNVTVVADIDKQLEQFWRLDGLDEDKQCEEEIKQANEVERDVDGRYVVRLPFVNGSPLIGDSFRIAKKQFERLEGRLSREPSKKRSYVDFMSEYERLNHMQEIKPSELNSQECCCYIPHHGIYQRDKIRVVFNASRKTSNGRSLNDELAPGPNLQARIVDILTRMREHQFVFVADVKKMYRQIRLHPEHSKFLRILWRDDPSEPLKHYRLLTVTYGTNCAPYAALRVMNQLAKNVQEAFPRAAEIIENRRYMDDVFGGDNDVNRAIEVRNELISAMRSGGFELGKWSSNSPSLLCDLNPKDLAVEPTVFENDDQSIKTLGVVWYPKEDKYSFSINLSVSAGLTKRGLLSELSRVFDPLGWLAPIIVKAKLLMQEVWRLKLDWDVKLPIELSNEWERLRSDLHWVQRIRLDRWIGEGISTELHGFADASKRAYGAVIYCHTKNDFGHVNVTLIAAKSKLAPMTQITIPRLELCAAALLSQLIRHYGELLHHHNPTIHCWSDSKVTLCWLARQSNELSVFVRNRVKLALSNCPIECWGYVPTKSNPADVISRGQYPSDLLKNELWWTGPKSFSYDKDFPDQWDAEDPAILQLIKSEITPRSGLCHVTTRHEPVSINKIIERFSSLVRLKRVISWCLKWVRLKRIPSADTHITFSELKQTFFRIIELTQREDFCDEYDQYAAKEEVNKSSKIVKLNPFLDKKNLLRVGGRLGNADIPESEKHPVILSNGHLATLIVREIHINNLHCGVRQTIFLCRRHYWILNLTRLVKKEIRSCERCTRYSGETYQPRMGQLPAVRVTEARAFYRTGVDYAGPFTLRAFRHRGKLTTNGYVAVFICLATKAVHFELVSSLDTGAFLAAYERFVARRGNCSELWSDNGRNFVGANHYLRNLFDNIAKNAVSDSIRDAMATRNVKWNFIPPYAPHFGGIWEAAVRIMKHHLKRTISNQVLTIEEFNTLLCRIEMIMNSRPLAPMTNNPDDYSVITPNHFLIGEGVGPLDLNGGSSKISLSQRIRLIEELTAKFWRSWEREYLRSLLTKSKWSTEGQEPAVGDLVIVRRNFQYPGLWKRARVQRLIPGDDGTVRVVDIFDGGTTRSEAVRNLIPLELNASHSTGGGCASNR